MTELQKRNKKMPCRQRGDATGYGAVTSEMGTVWGLDGAVLFRKDFKKRIAE